MRRNIKPSSAGPTAKASKRVVKPPARKAMIAKLARLLALQSACKEAYKEMDVLLPELVEYFRPGTTIQESGLPTVVIVDNFAEKDSMWKTSKFSRYAVQAVKAGKSED